MEQVVFSLGQFCYNDFHHPVSIATVRANFDDTEMSLLDFFNLFKDKKEKCLEAELFILLVGRDALFLLQFLGDIFINDAANEKKVCHFPDWRQT